LPNYFVDLIGWQEIREAFERAQAAAGVSFDQKEFTTARSAPIPFRCPSCAACWCPPAL